MIKMKAITLDMDGTFVDFYGVDGWLAYLEANDPTPYKVAKPLVNLSVLARQLNRLQKNGYRLEIVSWLSKTYTAEFDEAVTVAKVEWIQKHLPSVKFDSVQIVRYGTPKSTMTKYSESILFDDEQKNLDEWQNSGRKAVNAQQLLEVLKTL